MKFPIGFKFSHAFINYEVYGYIKGIEKPYLIRFWFDDDDKDTIQMSEDEIILSTRK